MTKRYFCSILLIYFLFQFSACKKDLLRVDNSVSFIDLEESSIPDFSYAGYNASETALPKLDDIFTITISPNESSNHSRLIQDKIDEISRKGLINGFRGILKLRAGDYFLDTPILINSSGIVIQGETMEYNERPVLHFTTHYTWRNVREAQDVSIIKIEGLNVTDTKIERMYQIKEDISTSGATTIVLNDDHTFVKGDSIVVVKTPNDDWINRLQTAQYGWTSTQYAVDAKRIIKSANKNSITIDIPLYDKILNRYGGGFVSKLSSKGYIFNCAVEGIDFISTFKDEEDESHIWSAVIIENATNCWLQDLRARNLSFALVSIINSSFTTVQDCAVTDYKSKAIGDRRYPYYFGVSSYGNLVQRCYAKTGRHDFATGARLTGPNVFLDCLGENSLAESGPHHRWAVGTLYDNISTFRIYARNAGNFGSGHGWTGAFNMFWNNEATFGFLIQNPPDATNWLIGGSGRLLDNAKPYVANFGKRVTPRSLFISQLTRRIGSNRANKIFKAFQLETDPVWDHIKRTDW